jgi:hypothetical protein
MAYNGTFLALIYSGYYYSDDVTTQVELSRTVVEVGVWYMLIAASVFGILSVLKRMVVKMVVFGEITDMPHERIYSLCKVQKLGMPPRIDMAYDTLVTLLLYFAGVHLFAAIYLASNLTAHWYIARMNFDAGVLRDYVAGGNYGGPK